MPYADNGTARLFWGTKGSGSPVLLVMGASYSSRMWYPVIDELASAHQVIWFDNRGIGHSSRVGSGSIEDMAADGLAVLDAAGVAAAHVYGVSLGGVVALQLALQAPTRVTSLVLGCTGILSDEKPRAPRWLDLAYRLPAPVRRGLMSRLRKGGYGSAAAPEAIARDLEVLSTDRPSSASMVQQQRALRAYCVRKEEVAALRVPALVLHGTEDAVVPYTFGQELTDALADATLVTVEGAGHNYFVAGARQANDALLRFLSAVDSVDAAAALG
jgi:pimeloyl-ACP methyl ester carboxylesterase